MTQITSQALQKVRRGTSEKVSLETTAETRRDAADVTWRGRSFQTQEAAAIGKARLPTVDNRVRRTISDYDDVYICLSHRGTEWGKTGAPKAWRGNFKGGRGD